MNTVKLLILMVYTVELYIQCNAVNYCICRTDSATEAQHCSTVRCADLARVQLTPSRYCSVLDGLICECSSNRVCSPCGCYKQPAPMPEIRYVNVMVPVEVPVYINRTIEVPVIVHDSSECNETIVYLNNIVEVPIVINRTVIVNETIYETVYVDSNCTGFEVVESTETNNETCNNRKSNSYIVVIIIMCVVVVGIILSYACKKKKNNVTVYHNMDELPNSSL
jgi:hypothetical protein